MVDHFHAAALEEIEEWNTKYGSLGYYCNSWRMKWCIDGINWEVFRPDQSNRIIAGDSLPKVGIYNEFITQNDWGEIERALADNYEPSVASYNLSRCHRLLSDGEDRFALIEGVSGLELAVWEFVRKKCLNDSLKNQVLGIFDKESHPSRMALVAYLTPGIDPADVVLAADAIKRRNAVIHDGEDPPANTPELLQAVMRVVAHLIGGTRFKFPRLIGNCRIRPEMFALDS